MFTTRIFKSFFNDSVFDFLAQQTDLYAQQFLSSAQLTMFM